MPLDMIDRSKRYVLLGASGRLGQLVRCFWPDPAQLLCQVRQQNAVFGRGVGAVIDPLAEPDALAAHLKGADVLIGLAGASRGNIAAGLDHHRDLAVAAINAARRAGVRQVLWASSAAVAM